MVQILKLEGFFFWNLSHNVGPRQPNKIDDVELVRFGYTCAKQIPNSNVTARMKEELDNLRPIGDFDKDLAAVIVAHQRIIGGTQDGIVSVDRSTNVTHLTYDGKHRWIMSALNVAMRDI